MLGGVFLLDFLFYFRIVNFSKNICIEALSGAFNFIENYMQFPNGRNLNIQDDLKIAFTRQLTQCKECVS